MVNGNPEYLWKVTGENGEPRYFYRSGNEAKIEPPKTPSTLRGSVSPLRGGWNRVRTWRLPGRAGRSAAWFKEKFTFDYQRARSINPLTKGVRFPVGVRYAVYATWMRSAPPDFIQSLIKDPGAKPQDRLWAELAGNLNQDLNQKTEPLADEELAQVSVAAQDDANCFIVSGPDGSADAPSIVLINNGGKFYLALANGDDHFDAVWPVTKDVAEIKKLWEQAKAQAPADPPAGAPPPN